MRASVVSVLYTTGQLQVEQIRMWRLQKLVDGFGNQDSRRLLVIVKLGLN
jgi:hypothetical protein